MRDFVALARQVFRPTRPRFTEAEVFARACALRLPPWNARTCPPIRWRTGRLSRFDLLARPCREPTAALHDALLGVHEDASSTTWDGSEPAWVIHVAVPRLPWPTPADCPDEVALSRLTREIAASRLWASAAHNGYQLEGAPRPVAELPDPFEPLFEIWKLGYALDEITADALVLVEAG